MTEDARHSRFDLPTIHRAARMYYLEGATQAQIAQALGVSRPQVSRLLSEGRRLGIVDIRVHDPAAAAADGLAEGLRDALDLAHVRLAPFTGVDLGPSLRDPFSAALRSAELVPGDTLLVSSGRTIFELSRTDLPQLPGVNIVPTVGGQAEPQPWYQTNEIARAFAHQLGGRPHFLFAQALPSIAVRASLQDDPSFQEVLDLWDGAEGAIVGIGAPPSARSSISAFVPRGSGALRDAVGDICLNFFAADGSDLHFPGDERMVRTTPELLRRIPFVLGVAVGEDKVPSIIAGARARLFNRLVTDTTTAELILSRLADQTAV
ncbi:MAG: helix-turn-helix domain-containing protein [Propionibacteriales bacterium]|nr:helix-turn-helix domain-containing protein [Propionibacteriales bacterium]